MPKSRPARVKKAAQKEIRGGAALFTAEEAEMPKEKLNASEFFELFPKIQPPGRKSEKKERKVLERKKHKLKIKKIKLRAQHSKRTTPGEVEGKPAAPHISHVESGRWEKTVDRQSVSRAHMVDRKVARGRKR